MVVKTKAKTLKVANSSSKSETSFTWMIVTHYGLREKESIWDSWDYMLWIVSCYVSEWLNKQSNQVKCLVIVKLGANRTDTIC